jgi:hypothetical protein
MPPRNHFIPFDTPPDVFRKQVEVLRGIGERGRARMTEEMCRGLRKTIKAGIRRRHPDYNEHQVKMALIWLTAGEEVFRRLLPGVKIEV